MNRYKVDHAATATEYLVYVDKSVNAKFGKTSEIQGFKHSNLKHKGSA